MVLLVIVVIVAGVAIVGGGNTFSGLGQDMANTSDKIENSTK